MEFLYIGIGVAVSVALGFAWAMCWIKAISDEYTVSCFSRFHEITSTTSGSPVKKE